MTQSISGAANPPVPGFTRFTGFGAIGGVPGPAKPSGIIVQDADGYDYYLWVDTAGKLRVADAATAEAAAFNWLTGGTIVGSQS